MTGTDVLITGALTGIGRATALKRFGPGDEGAEQHQGRMLRYE
jgi:NAD(P)-dependent dehydrogenase (short-subunit alcohol dehydrogenase family)